MAEEISAPFGPEDLEELQTRLAELEEAKALIAKANQAGLDIGDQETRMKDLETRLRRIKQTFFPGR